jgi:hypothetical protein
VAVIWEQGHATRKRRYRTPEFGMPVNDLEQGYVFRPQGRRSLGGKCPNHSRSNQTQYQKRDGQRLSQLRIRKTLLIVGGNIDVSMGQLSRSGEKGRLGPTVRVDWEYEEQP